MTTSLKRKPKKLKKAIVAPANSASPENSITPPQSSETKLQGLSLREQHDVIFGLKIPNIDAITVGKKYHDDASKVLKKKA